MINYLKEFLLQTTTKITNIVSWAYGTTRLNTLATDAVKFSSPDQLASSLQKEQVSPPSVAIMNDTFYKCFDTLLKWEGGAKYHKVKDDPGGATKYGISLRAYQAHYPEANEKTIEYLSYNKAAAFTMRNYWEPLQCEYMPPAIALVVFDHGFNRGVTSAKTLIQQSMTNNVASRPSGDINIYYLKKVEPLVFLERMKEMRLAQYNRIAVTYPKLSKFLKGWTNRVNDIHNTALQWAGDPWYTDKAETKEA